MSLEQQVLDVLTDARGNWFRLGELVDMTGSPMPRVQMALAKLEQDGMIERIWQRDQYGHQRPHFRVPGWSIAKEAFPEWLMPVASADTLGSNARRVRLMDEDEELF